MKNKPKILVRVGDGEEFVLNKNGSYSNKYMMEKFPGHLHHEWPYEVLMEKFQGFFKEKTT